MKKTLLILTTALSLSISALSAKADEGTQSGPGGEDAFSWETSTIDDQNGYYTHRLTIVSLAAYLHLSSVYCDQMGGDGGTYGYFGAWTFSYTTTNPQCQWHWTFEDTPLKYNVRNVAGLLKVGTRLSRSGKPGVVVKSNANGVSIKWKIDKMFWLDPSTETIAYTYQDVAMNLNTGNFQL